MEIKLLGFNQSRGFEGEQSVIHLYTTSAEAPYFVTVQTKSIPCSVTVPTKKGYKNLVFEHYLSYVNEEGSHVLNRAGKFVLNRKHCNSLKEAQFQFKREDDTDAVGWLHVGLIDLPANDTFYACSEQCQTLCDKIEKTASEWYLNPDVKPLDFELVNVHVPLLPIAPFNRTKNKLPGFFFMLRKPEQFEEEQFFVNLLQIAALRRFCAQETSQPDAYAHVDHLIERLNETRGLGFGSAPPEFMKFAQLVVEAVSLPTNMTPYNADVELKTKTSYTTIDRFSSDARVVLNGDCEDEAREILNIVYSLQLGKYTHPWVVAAQRTMRCYLATQQFGAVRLGSNDADPALAPYSTGGKLFAHSFVIFIPVTFVQAHAQDCTVEPYLLREANVWTSGVEVLTTDGISLFDPMALNPTHPLIQKRLKTLSTVGNMTPMIVNRLKSYGKIGTEYYMFLCSAFVINGLVSTKTGQPIFEFYFNIEVNTYGCKYIDLLEKNSRLKLISTYHMTPNETALATECCSVLHPIPIYNIIFNQNNVLVFETFSQELVKQGVHVLNALAFSDIEATIFVTANDMASPTFVTDFGNHLRGHTVCLTFENVAEDLFSVRVDVMQKR